MVLLPLFASILKLPNILERLDRFLRFLLLLKAYKGILPFVKGPEYCSYLYKYCIMLYCIISFNVICESKAECISFYI